MTRGAVNETKKTYWISWVQWLQDADLPELTRRGVEPAIVEIKTKDGSIYKERVEYRKGSPDNPMTMEELINKFRDCVSYSGKSFSKQDIDRVIQLVENLEDIEDVSLIVDLLG